MWSDLKFGLRMLIRYPMLTLVAGIAITVTTAIGVGASEFVHDMIAPEPPLEEGDRIVRLYQIDSEAGGTGAGLAAGLVPVRRALATEPATAIWSE